MALPFTWLVTVVFVPVAVPATVVAFANLNQR